MARRTYPEENPDMGFQIAPMIDVVFVVLVFFMSLTASVKIEHELNTKLPGTIPSTDSVDFPDEQVIGVAENGAILLNDEQIETPEATELRNLYNTLTRLKANATAARTKLLIIISSESEAPYYRSIDVLNILAALEISDVTFTVANEF